MPAGLPCTRIVAHDPILVFEISENINEKMRMT